MYIFILLFLLLDMSNVIKSHEVFSLVISKLSVTSKHQIYGDSEEMLIYVWRTSIGTIHHEYLGRIQTITIVMS